MWPEIVHHTASWHALAAGVIWAFFIGSVLGNLATNPIFRLPRGMHITKEKPFCDHCHTPLTPRDLFPIFSWLLARGRCRTCHVGVPSAYFWVELSFALLHVVAYLRLGFSEAYLLATTAVGALIAVSAMEVLSGYRSWRMLMLLLIPSLLWATLRDQSLHGVLNGLLYISPLLLFGVYLQQEKGKPEQAASMLRLALVLWMLAMWAADFAGFALGLAICVVVGYGVVRPMGRRWQMRHEAAWLIGLAVAIFSLSTDLAHLTAEDASGIVLAVPEESHLL
jgi:prepilin signal peptidase PulO-like enzyme (type II secretory pathway)